MDTATRNALSEIIGVDLTVRDNEELMDKTIDKLLPKIQKKTSSVEDAARVCTADISEYCDVSEEMIEESRKHGWSLD